jgi:hypothetical protein
MFSRNPYVLDMIEILRPCGPRGLQRADLITRIRQIRLSTGAIVPKQFAKSVQAAFNRHSSQSLRFKGPTDNDLFYSVGGKRSGVWAVHPARAQIWLNRRYGCRGLAGSHQAGGSVIELGSPCSCAPLRCN